MRKSVYVLLLISALLLVSCGPAMTPATGPATEGGEVFTIALPRIEVGFDEAGSPTLAGVDMQTVASLTGFDARSLPRMNKFYLDWMKNAGIQHIELRQGGDGVYVFVNGKPMPYLAWSDASLQRATDLASLFGVANTDAIRKFLPIVRRLGLDMVLRFPHQGADIPLADANAIKNLAVKPSGEAPSAVAQFELKYDQNGTPAVLGITPYDLAAMGLNLGATNLSPAAIAMLQNSNIQSLELRGKDDGVFVYVNGQPLPNIAWDNSLLTNASQVYGQMNDQNQMLVKAIQQLLPLVNKADLGVLVHFPVAPGKSVIPAKMHM
jgi:hypothetical protein